MLNNSVTINLPTKTVKRLERTARLQKQTIAELAGHLVVQATTPLPALSPDLETELEAFAQLSDETLWTLARSVLPTNRRVRLAWLNEEAQQRALSAEEQSEQAGLVEEYGRVLVRRAEAAVLLKKRGYDLSDPAVLQA